MLFLLSSLLALSVKASVVDCAVGKSLYTINRLAFYPDPPIPNQNATLELDFTAPDQPVINSGTVVYATTYNFIPLTPSTEDLCKDTICPIVPGFHTQSSSMPPPQGLSGTVIIKTNWYDDNKNVILCYSVTLKV